jgi:hypothetical protein
MSSSLLGGTAGVNGAEVQTVERRNGRLEGRKTPEGVTLYVAEA